MLEKIARRREAAPCSRSRTGAGKTFIAVNLLEADRRRRPAAPARPVRLRPRRTADARARRPSRTSSAPTPPAVQPAATPQKNARVHVATYQTLGVDSDDGDATFLTAHYPRDYFSHIVIDECHRSAWGKWSAVLTRNPDAVQIGLTATPRQLVARARASEAAGDRRGITRRQPRALRRAGLRVRHRPGHRGRLPRRLRHRASRQRRTIDKRAGWTAEDIGAATRATPDRTAASAATRLASPLRGDRASRSRCCCPSASRRCAATCSSSLLADRRRREQKTIIFCARDRHADDVAIAMNNLYADWCRAKGRPPPTPYAFKCTAAGERRRRTLAGPPRRRRGITSSPRRSTC